jgi:hypothetical protein
MIIFEKRSHPLQGEDFPTAANLLAGGLTTLFGAPITFLIGGIPFFVVAIVGWILRTSAEKSLAESATTMNIE